MKITISILASTIIILTLYIIFVQLQLRSINEQLDKRLTRNTRQPITLEMINKELNKLTININKCLKAEETLRLNSIYEEKKYKELIANISHDFRTPLTAIKGYQQLIGKDGLTNEQQSKLKIAQKHTEELELLIEHFFEYSYLINMETDFSLEQINLTRVVTECLVSSIPKLEENNLNIKFEETSPIFVLANKELLIRIIGNLIGNCISHSNSDIEVRLLVKNAAIISFRNSIENTREIDVSRLFDRFYTGDNGRNNSSGLGLAIVKLLSNEMNGSVDAYLKNSVLDIQVSIPLFKN